MTVVLILILIFALLLWPIAAYAIWIFYHDDDGGIGDPETDEPTGPKPDPIDWEALEQDMTVVRAWSDKIAEEMLSETLSRK